MNQPQSCATRNPSSGQALIETVILFPIIILLLCAIIDTSRYMLTRQQLLSAARYGTDLIVHQNFNKEQVEEELTNYLTSPLTQGRKLDKEKLKFQIEINGFPVIDTYSAEGNPLNLARLLASPFENDYMKYNATVEIQYELKLLKIISRLLGEESIAVSARSEVLKGTGIEKGHS